MPLKKLIGAAEFAKTIATSIDFVCITQEAQHVDTNRKLGCIPPTLERNKQLCPAEFTKKMIFEF